MRASVRYTLLMLKESFIYKGATKAPVRIGRSKAGFSILEILIVIAIIGILATVVITNFQGVFGSSQNDVAKTFVTQSLEAPLTAYRTKMGNYPSTEEGLKALLVPPKGKEQKWERGGGPFIKKLPEDPWGNPYHYAFPGKHNPKGYDVWSTGPGGPGAPESEFIGNWGD